MFSSAIINFVSQDFGASYREKVDLLLPLPGIPDDIQTGIRLEVDQEIGGGSIGASIFVFHRNLYLDCNGMSVGTSLRSMYVVDKITAVPRAEASSRKEKEIHWVEIPEPG
eukprot:Awhi_evm1s11876